MNTYISYVSLLLDSNAREESKLKAVQELSTSLETILNQPGYPEFLCHALKVFLKILQDGKPQFISEYTTQAIRKLLLEIIHRIPTNDHLKNHVKMILSLMFKLLEVENEENTLVCLRIIIELHKAFKPPFSSDIKNFFDLVKIIYGSVPGHLDKIFEPRLPLTMKDITPSNLDGILNVTFTATCVQLESTDKNAIQYNLLPRGVLSLKVLAELPVTIVLLNQLYKLNIQKEITEFIPILMEIIMLKPPDEHRNSENFNREVFIDLMAAQIKTLSFLAYIIRIRQDIVNEYSNQFTAGMLGLLRLCPHEVTHLRKELLLATRHIMATDLKEKFVTHLEELFDENILIGSGWTAYESLRLTRERCQLSSHDLVSRVVSMESSYHEKQKLQWNYLLESNYSGATVRFLPPLAYSLLADLVQHVRQRLPLEDLVKAVTVFSKNAHDETLVTTIQTMSCKLLMNLVECIQNASDRDENGREILIRMLEIFVLKLKTVAKLQLPVLIQKCRQQQQLQNAAIAQSPAAATPQSVQANMSANISQGSQPTSSTLYGQTSGSQGSITDIKAEHKEEPRTVLFSTSGSLDGKEEKPKFGFPVSQAMNYNLTDCQNLVKTLVCGAKAITWGCLSRKAPGDQSTGSIKQFQPRETLIYIQLFKYAFHAVDIYTLATPGQAHLRNPAVQTLRSKDEKETLEHLAGVYTTMNPLTFREIFSTTIAYMVDRILKNYTLQIVANSFLAHPTTSPIFAVILVEYLLKRMEEMGSNVERSNLYLKLFKLVFSSVSLFPSENEQMLKPYLHQIVNRSMELALTAKDPYNYFLLLGALFRSIGGGSHDLLYQEFLPLLPSLLNCLNLLQNGVHKQHMKELFVELCLTVPVRLSSLLPYLPMIMDPLASALNGPQTLVSQGLRTLELCIDNLQPGFLYDYIYPVRAELIQAMWNTLRNPNDSMAQVAFRVLGKFGGGNRKMVVESVQKLEYNTNENDGPSIVVKFPEHEKSILFPVEKVIETAFHALKSSTTDAFYRKQSWEVIHGFLAASIAQESSSHSIQRLLSHPSFSAEELKPTRSPLYKCPDSQARKVHKTALIGMYVAAANKELKPVVLPFMANIVRHYTAVMIAQQSDIFSGSDCDVKFHGMDPLVLIDATVAIMGQEDMEPCKSGSLALIMILDTCDAFFSSKTRASQLPFYDYLAQKMCSLCYERAWYAKLGGCVGIKSLIERTPSKWVYAHMFEFMKALLFVVVDLTGEVSCGAIDMAKSNLEQMISNFGIPLIPTCDNEDLIEAQESAINEVVQEFIRLLTVANTSAREQAIHCLEILAELSNKSVTALIEPHRHLLANVVPPCNPPLRDQPMNSQIGILEGNTYCFTLPPLPNGEKLFVIDLDVSEHLAFFSELFSICETEDTAEQKQTYHKSVTGLVPLKKAALRVLAALHDDKDKQLIFNTLYQALDSPHSELQETGFECLKQLISNWDLEDRRREMELNEIEDAKLREQRRADLNKEQDLKLKMIHAFIRPLLKHFIDYRNLNPSVVQQLHYLTQLFPNTFNENLCEQLLQHLRKWLEVITSIQNKEQEIKICSSIIDIFHQIPAARSQLIEPLLTLVFKTEALLCIAADSPFREPLIKFLQQHPFQTMEFFIDEPQMQDEQASRFLKYLLKGERGKPFREILQQSPMKDKLGAMALGRLNPEIEASISAGLFTSFSIIIAVQKVQYLAVHAISLLVKYDDQWLSCEHQLVGCLRSIWISDEFQERHIRTVGVDSTQWKEPKLLAKCLLNFFKHNPHEIELLFQLLRAFTGRFIPDFEFLRDFLENTVAKKYDVVWKRMAFFTFVKLFHDHSFPQNLKAKVLQYILIPSFAIAFERGEELVLIGGDSSTSPSPEQDRMEDVMSVFINKVIDPEKPSITSDAVRIMLLQFSCLLVEQASRHIHNAENKKQGSKLRRLMTFAWPCLLAKNCVDPATKYHGHLLLANIIAKFAIHKRIVLQVFHSLLKAHAAEARVVVRQALEILTPAIPVRMEDGNMLTHWTKKIIVEEGHTLAQLVHLLQLLVRHYKVYYPVRHHLIHHMVSSIQRLIFAPNVTLEHKKLAVDLAEVIIRWELQRHKEEQEKSNSEKSEGNMEFAKRAMEHQFTWGSGELHCQSPDSGQGTSMMAGRRLIATEAQDQRKMRAVSGIPCKPDPDRYKPVDKIHADNIINFLLRMACQVNETTGGSSGELLSRRCVALLKIGLKADVWPNAKLNLTYFDKLLQTVDGKGQQPNFGNICTALDLLAFLLTILRKETILPTFYSLQAGISACLKCNNAKVVRYVHNLLSRLMSLFPTETSSSIVTMKFEELEGLYATAHSTISEGLQAYEKSSVSLPSTLFGALMILKAVCENNPSYIDRLLPSFMKVLQKMVIRHLNPTTPDANPMHTDLLILSLDLVKSRVGVMTEEMRRTFINTLLVGLIEKSPSIHVLKAITKIVEDWMKNRTPVNQSPSIQEILIIQLNMMQFIEKRFPNELELNAQFLELIHYVYNDATLRGTELQSKLEPAFMAGLRCIQPVIRTKFFEVFNSSIHPLLHERLMYIVCSQNWGTIGPHFWIKQCIELLLATSANDTIIQFATTDFQLPSVTSILSLVNSNDKGKYAVSSATNMEPMDEDKEDEVIVIELSNEGGHTRTESITSQGQPLSNQQRLPVIISNEVKFLESIRKIKTINFLTAAAQLCHMDTTLAQHVWVQLFPRLWGILTEQHRNVIAIEIPPFLCSTNHVIQKHCHPSAAGTFAEGVVHCVPPIPIKPRLLKYLGKSHNLWHRSCLLLEELSFEKGCIPSDQKESLVGASSPYDALNMISDLYSQLKEEDLWSAIWQKHSKFPETVLAVRLEQHGFFEFAQGAYENAMVRCRQEMIAPPNSMQSECNLIPAHWIKCCRELNDWETILEYSSSKIGFDPYLVLENAWRKQDWGQMKEALELVEQNCPQEIAWKVNLYKGYLSICNPEDRCLNVVEQLVDISSNLCIREWRRLPHVVSHVHLPILQASQQIMELQDAVQIHQGLLPSNAGHQPSLNDMKGTVKTWKNRLPILSDNLSHWSEIFAWRHEHYRTIVSSDDPSNPPSLDNGHSDHASLGYQALTHSLVHFAKVARKHGLISVSLDVLQKVRNIPSVSIAAYFQKIRQELKCYLQMAYNSSKSDPDEARSALYKGLEVIELTYQQHFSKEMIAEFYTMGGIYLSQLGQLEEANKVFGSATQLHNGLVKAWAAWGDYLEQIFTRIEVKNPAIHIAVEALKCFLNACRHQNEGKARKYMAKVMWLLTYDDHQMQLTDTINKYSEGVPPIQWVAWVPQLLTYIMQNDHLNMSGVLSQVTRGYPQALYLPVRTQYLTLEMQQREKGNQQAKSDNNRVTSAMWHCSCIISLQRQFDQTVIFSLENIVDQMVWFRENVFEELLRKLWRGLAECYALSYANAEAIAEARITPNILNVLKHLVSVFDVEVEGNLSPQQANSATAIEALTQRAETAKQDSVFRKMKKHFISDFDLNACGALKLHDLINKLRKWIRILEAKTKLLPKSFLIGQKSRFLSLFSQHTADIELPGEFLFPKHKQSYIRIAQFMPRVDIIQKHNVAARRLYIKGHNGKIYPHLVIDACPNDAQRQERVLQLLRMLNGYLGKEKETIRRFLNFTIPRVVTLSPHMRLIEDNIASTSLLNIYKQCCKKHNVESDAPIHKYFESLATIQAYSTQTSQRDLCDIFEDIRNNLIPKNALKKWAEHTYPTATEYWTFRKQLTLQLSLVGFIEHVLHLTRLNLDMMCIQQDSGLITVSYFMFNVNDVTGELISNQLVPFRLTPNIAEFINPVGIHGPFSASMTAVARCLAQPKYKVSSFLKAILRDDIANWYIKRQNSEPNFSPKDTESSVIIQMVTEAVSAINQRLTNMAEVGVDNVIGELIATATDPTSLSRMDPAWHPWF